MKDEIFPLLTELSIPYRFIEHPAVFTVAESMGKIKDKRPIKNLLLSESKGERVVLVIMDGGKKLDTNFLARRLGIKKLQFAKPEILKATLGVEPGSVSLFGVLHAGSGKVEVVVDQSLMSDLEIGFHPNLNTATIFISGHAVEKILQKTGHSYRVLKLENTK